MNRIFLSLGRPLVVLGLMSTSVQPVIRVVANPTVMAQSKIHPETVTFTGTILKNGETFVLNDSVTKTEYMLDKQDKLSPYEGKRVKITGRLDATNNLIHIETIEQIA